MSWANVLVAAENFFHHLKDESSVWDDSLEALFKKNSFNFTNIVLRKNMQGNETGMVYFYVFVSCIFINNLYLLYHYLLIKLITNIEMNHELKWKCKNSQWLVKDRLFCVVVISQALTGENGAEK